MLKAQKKHIDKEQGKTIHGAPRRTIQNKNNIGTIALELSVVYTTGGFKGLSLYKLHPGSRYNSSQLGIQFSVISEHNHQV